MTVTEFQGLMQQATALLSAPAVSAFIGGLTGVAGSWFISWRTFKRDKEHTAKATFTAIKAEIRSIVELMEFANYEQGMRLAIETIEKTQQPYFYEVPVQIELFTKVYSENLANLGTLKEKHLPDIVSFYANVHGLVMDLENVKPKPPHPALAQNQLHTYKLDVLRVSATIKLGKKISDSAY